MRDELTVLPRPARAPSPTPRDLLAVFFRQRELVLVSFFTIFLGTLVYGILAPSYQAHMKILLRRGRVDPTTTPMVPQAAPFPPLSISEEDLNSEVELLRDQEILRTVVSDSGLSRDSWLSRLRAQSRDARLEKESRKLAQQLEVRPVRKTSLIEITYPSSNPAQAATVLRCLAQAYLERHVRMQQPSGEFDFFSEQVGRAQRALERVQLELVGFTRDEGIVSAALERDNALQRLNESESNSRQVDIQIAESAKRFRALAAQLPNLPERRLRQERSSDNPELLEKLKSRLLDLQLKRTELLTRFVPTYRLVQELDIQIAEAAKTIADEQSLPLRDQTTDSNPDHDWAQSELIKTHIDLIALRSRATAMRISSAIYRKAAIQLASRALRQDELLRDLKTAESSYLLYVNKREEARIGDALDQGGLLNVTLAEQPSIPALPSRSMFSFAAIGVLVGGLCSTAAAFVADGFDPSFRTPEELTSYLGTAVLASLPQRIK